METVGPPKELRRCYSITVPKEVSGFHSTASLPCCTHFVHTGASHVERDINGIGHTCVIIPLFASLRRGTMAFLGRRCKTRLERRAIVRHISDDLSAKRGGGNVHRLLTRGILTLSPIVRSLSI